MGFPKFKSKKNPKQSFQDSKRKRKNNIRITNRRIRLAKLGLCALSPPAAKYTKLLKKIIKSINVTVKRENGKIICNCKIITTTGKKVAKDR